MSALVWTGLGLVLGLLFGWRIVGARSRLRLERKATEIADRDRRIAALQARLSSLDARLLAAIAAQPEHGERVQEESPPALSVAAESPSEAKADDLTRIRGIGPKLSQLLQSLGITRFTQIAAFDAADLAALDDKLGAFRGRAVRDDWVGQAATICQLETD